jgi:hypothetical protein
MEIKELQPQKAPNPIFSTLSAIVMEVSELQPEKVISAISDIPLGIAT